MNIRKDIEKNKHGYYGATPPPSIKELSDFYGKQYYQNEVPGGTCVHNYSAEKLAYKTNAAKVAEFERNKLRGNSGSLLDTGCGEGFIANFFSYQRHTCLRFLLFWNKKAQSFCAE